VDGKTLLTFYDHNFKNCRALRPSDLTLSMIRSIKRNLLQISTVVDVELSTVALTYVYFEKLVLKGVVSKGNRRLVASTCMLLALKINDVVNKIKGLLEELERAFGVLPGDVIQAEFPVFAQLNFHLVVPARQYVEHFVRLLKEIPESDASTVNYLGDDLNKTLEYLESLVRSESDNESEDESDASEARSDEETE